MFVLDQIWIYPVKSLGGIALTQSIVTPRGLEFDRWWMLVDEEGRFLSQRTTPSLALFRTAIFENELQIIHTSAQENILRLNLHPQSLQTMRVRIWEDTCDAMVISPEADRWFSDRLNQTVHLVYMPSSVHRYVDTDYATHGETTGFSDGFPVLLIGQSSLDDLNRRLQHPVPMDRFRPNLVFSGGYPFQEDTFRELQMNNVKFSVVKPCARCVMTTINQSTGIGGREPLHTLASYRTQDNKILFGQNLLVNNSGILHTGVELMVVK